MQLQMITYKVNRGELHDILGMNVPQLREWLTDREREPALKDLINQIGVALRIAPGAAEVQLVWPVIDTEIIVVPEF